jgi:hypothetical protein
MGEGNPWWQNEGKKLALQKWNRYEFLGGIKFVCME